MVLRQMQRLLEGIYDVPTSHDVANFLFTDRKHLPPELRATRSDEQVLVAEHNGAAEIGLFLDAGVLQRLDAANPLDALHGGNLADFWTALEGVSHFMYLAWNAGHDRAVSLLELELQASAACGCYARNIQRVSRWSCTTCCSSTHASIQRWPANGPGCTPGPIATRRASAVAWSAVSAPSMSLQAPRS